MRALIASARRPGAASARAASAAISVTRCVRIWPSASPSRARMATSSATVVLEAGDHRGFGGAPILLALVLVEDLDHALERENAVEARLGRFAPARRAP